MISLADFNSSLPRGDRALQHRSSHPRKGPKPRRARQTTSCRADPLTVSGQFPRPPAGSFVAVSGQFLVAADRSAGPRGCGRGVVGAVAASWVERTKGVRAHSAQRRLLALLADRPVLTVTYARKHIRYVDRRGEERPYSRVALGNALAELERRGIVRRVAVRDRAALCSPLRRSSICCCCRSAGWARFFGTPWPRRCVRLHGVAPHPCRTICDRTQQPARPGSTSPALSLTLQPRIAEDTGVHKPAATRLHQNLVWLLVSTYCRGPAPVPGGHLGEPRPLIRKWKVTTRVATS